MVSPHRALPPIPIPHGVVHPINLACCEQDSQMAVSTDNGTSAAAAASPGPVPRTATLFACVTTMSNTVLGVSVVGVAGGFARAGFAVSRQQKQKRTETRPWWHVFAVLL